MLCVDTDDLSVADGADADADSVEEDGADEDGLLTTSRWEDRRSIIHGGL